MALATKSLIFKKLIECCEVGNLSEFQRIIIESGYSHNDLVVDDELLSTCLQIGAANGHEDLMKYMLKLIKDANCGLEKDRLNACNSEGWNSLLQASRNGHTSIIKLLIKYEVDLNIRTKLGATPLICAARSGHLSSVRVLIDEGFDIHEYENCEVTPLMVAAQCGYDAIVKHLLERKCDVNFRSKSAGLTALMLAVANNHVTTVKLLLQMGADVKLVNKGEMTALDIASTKRKNNLLTVLSQAVQSEPNQAQSNIGSHADSFTSDIERKYRGSLSSFGAVSLNAISSPNATGQLDISQSLFKSKRVGKSWWNLVINWQKPLRKSLSPNSADYNKNANKSELPNLNRRSYKVEFISKSADCLDAVYVPALQSTVSPCRLSTIKQSLQKRIESLLPLFEEKDNSFRMPPGQKFNCASKWVTTQHSRSFRSSKDELYEELKRFALEDCYKILLDEELDLESLVLLNTTDVNNLEIESAERKERLLHMIEYLKDKKY